MRTNIYEKKKTIAKVPFLLNLSLIKIHHKTITNFDNNHGCVMIKSPRTSTFLHIFHKFTSSQRNIIDDMK